MKYLIIFYGHYIELVCDRTVVNLSRLFCFVWALFITLVESQRINLSKTLDFLALTTGKDQTLIEDNHTNPYAVMFSLFLVNVIVMIYIYVKIEIYKAKETSLNIDFSGYTLGSIRKVVGLIIYLGLLFLLRLIFPFTNHNEILIEWIINQFLIMVIVPAFMIVKNEKILQYAKTLFESCNNNMYSLNV